MHVNGGDIDESESMTGYWAHRSTFLPMGDPVPDCDCRPVRLHHPRLIVGSRVRGLFDGDLRHRDNIGEAFDICVEFLHDIRIALCECALENKAMVRCNQMRNGRCMVHVHEKIWNGIDRIAEYLSV